ncbi:microfibril-associated glycoprotein 4 [Drosophila subobscura]|uniref:microfibril-associated glycoprotein 4 n=1 Tax=Drosophila subobscura TaxID=7241 RepID=UPI00155ACE36|nr:microfibril-associated glycoprotein 4 [Drosophila subobscura]
MELCWLCISILTVGFHLSYGSQSSLEVALEKAEGLLSSLRTQIEELKQVYGEAVAQNKHQEAVGYPSSCLAASTNTNGVHAIQVPGLEPFPVFCDTRLAGSGWTVIQRRQDGSENFYRSWSEYAQGFGDLSGEFFMGLERLHFLTLAEPYELFVHLEDFYGGTRYARYEDFVIGNASASYPLAVLGKYSGDAGDSLSYQKGMPFSTFDHDDLGHGCAMTYVGAWWYNDCQFSNLNGQYVDGGRYEAKLSGRGICWMTWMGYDYGYKVSQMMIRPKCSNSIQRQRQRRQSLNFN